jgi:hypothetical protein
MTQQEAEAKAIELNATRYAETRNDVKAVKYGTTWSLVGCAKKEALNASLDRLRVQRNGA